MKQFTNGYAKHTNRIENKPFKTLHQELKHGKGDKKREYKRHSRAI
jgi:hypothetical protein